MPSISKEAKDALVEAFNIKSEYAEDDAYLEGLQDAVKIVESFPISDWIPVSERKPNETQDVICFGKGFRKGLTYAKKTDSFIDDACRKYKVTHWQPIPSPPTK